jgi:hypothetical protein
MLGRDKMPAHVLSKIRPKRPLTCDACSKAIVPTSAVGICTHCKKIRHLACSTLPCASCGSLHRRSALYRGAKILRYF